MWPILADFTLQKHLLNLNYSNLLPYIYMPIIVVTKKLEGKINFNLDQCNSKTYFYPF